MLGEIYRNPKTLSNLNESINLARNEYARALATGLCSPSFWKSDGFIRDSYMKSLWSDIWYQGPVSNLPIDQQAYSHIAYIEDPDQGYNDIVLKAVVDFCVRYDKAVSRLNLSYVDFMKMDYGHFKALSKIIREVDRKIKKSTDETTQYLFDDLKD
jgi:hypothetical protein